MTLYRAATLRSDLGNQRPVIALRPQRLKMSSRRESEYRGYRIEMERRDLCWTVSVSPTRPELPILFRSSFPTITQSERAALAQAQRRVDRALRH
jgi:hypothetical protein